ncbi:MAG: hypothetical protein EKE20_16100 [Candidatus Symbiopectobacterium sp. Dall1.0]|nr:hypothetical protein [Candidatus Symbiopectobacterium sp. Dall1.0]
MYSTLTDEELKHTNDEYCEAIRASRISYKKTVYFLLGVLFGIGGSLNFIVSFNELNRVPWIQVLYFSICVFGIYSFWKTMQIEKHEKYLMAEHFKIESEICRRER